MACKSKIIEMEAKLIINDQSLLPQCRKYISTIIDILKTHQINTNSDKLLGLVAHIYAMVERISKNEAVFEIDEEIQNQIDEKYKAIAKECISPIKKENEILNESSEVFLIAVHIQNLIESESK